MLDALVNDAMSTSTSTCDNMKYGENNSVCSMTEDIDFIVNISQTFVELCHRISAVTAIDSHLVVQRIVSVGSGWKEAELCEGSNSYVEDLCDRCASLWEMISCWSIRSSPPPNDHSAIITNQPEILDCTGNIIRTYNRMTEVIVSTSSTTHSLHSIAWNHILQASYMTILHGFSLILTCSTEGRALMSMDLAAYSAGISSESVMERILRRREMKDLRENEESRACVSRMLVASPGDFVMDVQRAGMQHVDAYIKAFYFGEEDLMSWINENCGSYKLGQSLALIMSSSSNSELSSSSSRSKIQQQRVQLMVDQVKNLYEQFEGTEMNGS